MSRSLVATSFLVASALATPLAAQQADTARALPFRRGQWGMDFGISSPGVYRLGAIRFTAPNRAWVLDGRIAGRIDREQRWAAPGDSLALFLPNQDMISQGASVTMLVGRRAYRAMGTRAMRTVSFSVGGGLGYDEAIYDGRRQGRALSWNGMVEGAIGGHYRVTPSLALGATMRLGARYTSSEWRNRGARQHIQHVDVGLGTSDLALSLFF